MSVKQSKYRLYETASALAVCVLAATGARAQDMPAAPAPAARPSAAEISSGQLEDIIVTATRRSENLQKTAVPVTVVAGDELVRQGVVQPQDLNKVVPGLTISPTGANTQVYLRGVGTALVFSYSDSAVAVNVDGVNMGFPGLIAGQFYDLQRVEALKGPQGTLYGRNATAGAINLITNRPTHELGADVSVELGSYDLFRVAGAVNVPLNDSTTIRVAGQSVRRDGYFNDGYDDDHSDSVRLQTLFEPVAGVSVILAGDYVNTRGKGSAYVPVGLPETKGKRTGPSTTLGNGPIVTFNLRKPPVFAAVPTISPDGYSKTEAWGAHAELNVDLGFGTLTAIPAYRHLKLSALGQPGFQAYADASGEQTSLEARLSSPTDQDFKWILGGYYFDSRLNNVNDTRQGASNSVLTTRQDVAAYAAFGEATYSILPSLRLSAGLRYTHENRDQQGRGVATSFPPIGNGTSTAFALPGDASFNNVSGKAGLEFDIDPRSLLYATYSTGFKSGGFNPDAAPNAYKQEILKAYTVGSKNRFFDNKLQVNIEAFYWDYRDHQEVLLLPLNAVGAGLSPLIVNIGKSSVKGANVALQYQASANDLFSFDVEYLDATFDSFVYPNVLGDTPGVTTACAVRPLTPAGNAGPVNVDCSGKPFTRAPKWNGNAAYEHTVHLANAGEIFAGANAAFASGSFQGTRFLPVDRQGRYALIDLRLGYRAPDGRWSITGNARNITDKQVKLQTLVQPFGPRLNYQLLKPPRTYSITLQAKL